jgi:predicted CXXCH cytochrome family protein
MKKVLVLFAVLTCTLWVSAQISGTAHDFSGETWNSTGRICIVCHTPHQADTSIADAPLWNHEVTAVAAYTLYSSTTLNATLGQPNGLSRLCLSCHDGTVALENFGGASGGTNFVTAGNGLVGDGLGDISTEHPIGFDYTTALATADGELHDPSTQASGLGGTITADLLFSDSLECASCHDVHGTGNSYLLRVDNAGSAFCLTCHDK